MSEPYAAADGLVRVYPADARRRMPRRAPTPALVWAHGGGFVAGDLDMPEADWVAPSLAARGVTVVSIDYRLAGDGRPLPRRPPTTCSPRGAWTRRARRRARHRPRLGSRSAGRARAATSSPARCCGSLDRAPTRRVDGRRPLPSLGRVPRLPDPARACSPQPDAALRAAARRAPRRRPLRPRRACARMYEDYLGGPVDDAPLAAVPGPRRGIRPRGVPAGAHDQRRGRRTARLGRGCSPATLVAAGRAGRARRRARHRARPPEPTRRARGIRLDRPHRAWFARGFAPAASDRHSTRPPRPPLRHHRRNHLMTNQAAADLIARSNRLGADPKNTNYAGGNTSAKGTETDPVTGEPVELLWVKGSGGDLGTLTEQGLAVLRLDRLRALVDVYPGVDREDEMVAAFDYTPARQGRRRAVDRHGHARPRRRRARRPPAPRLGHRDRDRGRRRGAHGEDLRRQGRVGAVAPPGLPARPRHRRDQGAEPAGDRLHPRRPRHHRVGRHVRGGRARTRSGSSTPPPPTSPSTARPSRSAPCVAGLRGARAGRAPRQGRRARGDDPRPRLARPAHGRPLHRRATRCSTSSPAPSTRASPRSARAAPTTSCARRSSRMVLDLPADASIEDIDRPPEGAARGRTAPTTRRTTTRTRRPSRPRSAAPTRSSCSCPASACSATARTSRPPASPASSTSTRST